MTSPITIVGFSGSLRRQSINGWLLRSALELVPAGVHVEIGTIRGIPLFDQDVEERDGIPEAVTVLKEQIARASGVVLATPEYNGAIPGVTKNALDWLTRPYTDIARVFKGRPLALIGASGTPSGCSHAVTAWRPILAALGLRTFEPHFGVPTAFRAFDQAGTLVDEKVATGLRAFMMEFVASIARIKEG